MRTILLSLCLLLAACGTVPPVADTTARPQSDHFSTWTNSTLKLLIPGTAGPPAVSSKTIEVPAKTAEAFGPFKLMAVYDPVANVTSVVMPAGYAGISSPSGLMVFEILSRAIAWHSSYVVLPGNDVDSAIAQFEKKFNEESFTEFWLRGPIIRLTADSAPYFFSDWQLEHIHLAAEPVAGYDPMDNDKAPLTVEGYELTDNILRIDLKNGISKEQAVFWIDLKEHKQINSAFKGKVE